jgi:AraC-like DNA-binding protein
MYPTKRRFRQQRDRLAEGGVSARFAHTLLQEVAAIELDADALLRRLGMPFKRADLKAGRVTRVSDQHFVRLHGECITALSVQANREGGMPPMSKDEVDMLCYCVITCETLAEVIDRARRFCAMLDLARELLLPEAGLKLEELARRLGFADARAFRRAFLAWTGKTPDEWRREA